MQSPVPPYDHLGMLPMAYLSAYGALPWARASSFRDSGTATDPCMARKVPQTHGTWGCGENGAISPEPSVAVGVVGQDDVEEEVRH